MNTVVVFRYHKAHLTRRLILDTSADSEMEENMVEWLRVILPEFAYVKCFLPKLKVHWKFQTLIVKILRNELFYGKIISKRFHLIGIYNTCIGFRPKTQDL